MKRGWVFPFVLALAGCGSCGSSGHLVGPLPNASFVGEKETLIAVSPYGISRVALDGSRVESLFEGSSYRVLDVTRDYRTYVLGDSTTTIALGDSTTTIALGDATTKKVAPLEAAKGRASEAVLSPDGKTLVVSRHADFSKPGSPDDDTLFVVDVATRTTREIASTSTSWPTTLRYSADGTHVFAKMAFEKPSQWIDLASGARTIVPAEPAALYVSPVNAKPSCGKTIAETKWVTELALVDDAGARTVVAREEGRKRGFHDYQADFNDPRFTPGCGYVTFGWGGHTYVAEANGGGKLASLGPLSVLFFAPPF